jgi:glutamyl-tRNA synthetase
MTVRTRIAPSPTGDPHVGTAYIALFNYCFARQHGGQFLLRIEDTDQARSSSESEKAILDSLRWLGLDWDEGPDKGGEFGPYRQSERGSIYGQYVEQLLAQGHAFKCFRTTDELEALRAARQESGQHTALKPSDLILDPEETAKRVAQGAPYVVRMKVPENAGPCPVADLLRGDIILDWSQVDAQILLKSDGMPTYHLANVVDDHLMGITHVIRGEEWLNSAPKHILLYQYLGWEKPIFCHLPLLRNPDKSKLSKRKNPTSILYYQRMGYLPEALLNYLGRMGWSMPDEREKFSLHTMLEHFDIHRVSLGGPIFDLEKLNWLNGLWIREDLNVQALADKLQAWGLNRDNLLTVLPHAQQRMNILSDFIPLVGFMLAGNLPIGSSSFDGLKVEGEACLKVLQFTLWDLEALRDWNKDTIFAAIKRLAEGMGLKVKDFIAPIFIAISGSTSSISITDAMAIIGPDMTRARLRHGVETLGGVGKKIAKRFEKEYQQIHLTKIDPTGD